MHGHRCHFAKSKRNSQPTLILPHVFGAVDKLCELLTSVNGNFESKNVVKHAVPCKAFKFLQDRRIHEMIPKFVKMNLSGQNDNKNRVEVGKYKVNKFKVQFWVEHKCTHVRLELN